MTDRTTTHPPFIENPHPLVFEDAALDDIQPGDHVAWKRSWERGGITLTTIREGIAHHQDEEGDWFTEDGKYITDGEDEGTTITIRRPVQEPPTKDGDIIEANGGCEFIEAVVDGTTYYAREARLSANVWWAVWRTNTGKAISYILSKDIITDTWKKSNG